MENVEKKRGRPSRFRPEFAEKARTLGEFGATRSEIAAFFGVDEETLRRWAAKDSAFADAIKTGAARADERVSSALYQRALGFTRDEEVALSTPAGIQKITVKKVVDSDVRAAALWLANRTNFSLNPRGQSKAVDLGGLDGSAKSLGHAAFKLLKAVESGTLTPEAAASAAGILEIAARALQVSELEERLERIENPRAAVPALITDRSKEHVG
jgi:hypothetical protein